MKKVFNLANKYMVLTIPLILFSLISSIYLTITSSGKIINLIFALFLSGLMVAVFLAGWFNMIKHAISEKYYDEPNKLLKEFVPGVGEYFLSTLGALAKILILSLLIIIGSYYVGMALIGDTGVSAEAFSKALETPQALKIFVTSLTTEQLSKLNSWYFFILSILATWYFVLMLYFPALFYKSKNPCLAFFYSLKDLINKKFFITLSIYILIFCTNFFISFISTLFMNNSVIHFVTTLMNFYFITVASVGVFYYYYENFINTQIGQNIDTEV